MVTAFLVLIIAITSSLFVTWT